MFGRTDSQLDEIAAGARNRWYQDGIQRSSLSVSFTATSSDDWVPSCSIKVVCIIHHSLSTENPSRTFMSRILRGLKCVIAEVLRFWIWRIASWPYHCLYLTCQWSQHQKGNLLSKKVFQMGWVGCWAGLTLLVSTLGPEDLIQWYT